MSTLSDSIADAVRTTALGANFTQVAPRRWASQRGDLRYVFEFEAVKGASCSARWGIDLPICPVVGSNRLSSKMALEKARLDLVLDPIDVQGDLQAWHSVSEFDQPSSSAVFALAKRTTSKALAELEPIATLSDFRTLFQTRADMAFRRFSSKDYVQTDLCWGLVCHALNDQNAGDEHIARFCERFDFPPDTPALVRAVKAATALSETKQ